MATNYPTFEHGFATYANLHPEVGDPLTPEYNISPRYNVQETTNGLLVYSVSQNLIDFADFTNPQPPPTSQIEAIDVSNHQSWANDPATAKAYLTSLSPQPTRVIVRLASYLESTTLRAIAIQQLQTFAALSLQLEAYVWCYRGADPIHEANYANAQIIESHIPYLDTIWQDHETYNNEPGPSTEWAEAFAHHLTSALQYKICGIYTGKYYWEEHHARGLPNLPLWIANYSPSYTLDTVPLPSLPDPWTSAQGWQYTSSPCDRNVFRA